jgi:hypothetical protein
VIKSDKFRDQMFGKMTFNKVDLGK